MEERWDPIERYDPVGGNLALDLANTTSRAPGQVPHEKLHAYEDLVVWMQRTGLSNRAESAALRAEAGARARTAEGVFSRAIELRDAIFRIFSAVAAGEEPEAADVDILSGYLEEGAGHRRLERRGDGWGWRWEAGEEPLARFLWPTAYAAADLLMEGDLTRVKECGNDDCTWLFVDMSKNRSRRWCDMKDCGNRAKARRHYRRQKRKGK